MQLHYFDYCQPGNIYYDLPAAQRNAGDEFGLADPPAGWTSRSDAEWTVFLPFDVDLPSQGWKIHVSATMDNAERIFQIVEKYCFAMTVAFKVIRSRTILQRRNSKYGDRSASGKFVTVYPTNEGALERTLGELGSQLEGEQGPYILSDLRVGSGPLYVRYGGFVARMAPSPTGELVYCIENPDGELVPDHRGPGFRPPDWVTPPQCLQPSLVARNTGTLNDFPYRVQQALHFSNGGGVYRAVDTRDGRIVLMKEARPLAGLDEDGTDAVARLRSEHWALRTLVGLDCIPDLVDHRSGHEHQFLLREYVDGLPLIREIMQRNPLVTGTDDAAAAAGYVRWAQKILFGVEQGLTAMHRRGVVFGDLHPSNILVQPDGEVRFIDFETSHAVDDNKAQAIGAPGFRAPLDYRGVDVDRYALGCLRLALYLPLTVVLPWSSQKADQFIDLIGEHFPVPAGFGADVRRDLGPRPYPGAVPSDPDQPLWPAINVASWPDTRRAIVIDMVASATPDRFDRLYPGDVEQFRGPQGGLTFGHGAAGVLWALHRIGEPVPQDHLSWLLTAIRRDRPRRQGFLNGLAGVVYALHSLGRTDSASSLWDIALSTSLDGLDRSLSSGLSGIGLTALQLAHDNADRRQIDVAENIADRLLARSPSAPQQTRSAGLIGGESGVALFLIRLFEATGRADLLDLAADVVLNDLGMLGWSDRESTDGTWRSPLLADGGAGTAMVLHELLHHRPDNRLCTIRDAIRDSLRAPFLLQAGLLRGRAGTLLALRHLTETADGADISTEGPIQRHVAGFGWHAARHNGRLGFLGDQSLRMSTDLATGTAGILLALHASAQTTALGLPFFDRPNPTATGPTTERSGR